MIRPGLSRITALLHGINLPWRAVHVAGTNGKGSICAYLSALFISSGMRCGRFTSPHLLDRWDCISINDAPIAERIFLEVEAQVQARNERESIDASEFEILTATAFEIFSREKVQVAVVECGLGGRLDATNVLVKPLVTVISRIGLDHQGILGDTIRQIAGEKAGIMKTGIKCVVDGTSDVEALDEIGRVAVERYLPMPKMVIELDEDSLNLLPAEVVNDMPAYQLTNLACALHAFRLARQALSLGPSLPNKEAMRTIAETRLPGRFQRIDISKLIGYTQFATLDGAHNLQAWSELFKSVETLRARSEESRLIWVIAASAGKNTREMFQDLPDTDDVVLTQFGPVDGMPWVEAMSADTIMPWRAMNDDLVTIIKPDPLTAIREAVHLASGRQVIIAGSLYLVADVLRLLRKADA